jgi:LytS/YehU family sensor histidine kinase
MTRMGTRTLALSALWIAGVVALGHLLAAIPNVELVTASVFLGGVVLGPGLGGLIGLLSELLYSVTSPFGVAAPPLLVAQVLSMAVTGMAGGIVGRDYYRTHRPPTSHMVTAVIGLALTVLFDLLTTASFLVFSGITLQRLGATLLFGLGFSVAHVAWNTVVFATVVPILGKKLPGLIPWSSA